MNEVYQCGCGGEMYLDSFEHPNRPVEWLYRCSECGRFTAVASTPEESLALLNVDDIGDRRDS